MSSYEDLQVWLHEDHDTQPHLLLGNGFSMAFDLKRFSYSALADQAKDRGLLPEGARKLLDDIPSSDFENVLRKLEATASTLATLDASMHAATINQLRSEIKSVREALASSIAGLHPERPQDIADEAYARVRKFLDSHKNIYTVNYDLLTYWALMQNVEGHGDRRRDDGFRDSGVSEDETVLWDIYDPFGQNIYYLHGALHLFNGSDGLRKITYSRTNLALIDQVRNQLEHNSYPLYVAEGESSAKLARIGGSAYLARGLRSLKSCGGTMLVYGHSLDQNDEHVLEAVVRSKIEKLAISLYGDQSNEINTEIKARVAAVKERRNLYKNCPTLMYRFFDAESVELW